MINSSEQLQSQITQRNYSHAIKAFCEFAGKDPDQLIIEAEKEIKQGFLMRQRYVKDLVELEGTEEEKEE